MSYRENKSQKERRIHCTCKKSRTFSKLVKRHPKCHYWLPFFSQSYGISINYILHRFFFFYWFLFFYRKFHFLHSNTPSPNPHVREIFTESKISNESRISSVHFKLTIKGFYLVFS